MTVVNALTIDVEEYFQVHAFSKVISLQDWDSIESRVERSTHRLLDLLDSIKSPSLQASEIKNTEPDPDRYSSTLPAANCQLPPGTESPNPVRPIKPELDISFPRATFFVLGWIAERHPAIVREIHSRGHEVACHGRVHKTIIKQSQEEFKEDVKRAKGTLEDLIGTEVIGYRAPTYSIIRETLWALGIISEMGFRYDSSIFPINHDFYGFPEAPRFPFLIDFSVGNILSQIGNPEYLLNPGKCRNTNCLQSDNSAPHAPCSIPSKCLVEFPISTISILGRNLPCSGGGYFRLFPYWLTKWGIKRTNRKCLSPTIFYIHPWELDPEIPMIKRASRLSKFRTYVNLRVTESRFKRLLEDFRFAPLASML